LENIHSICWDDQSERSKKIYPELQRKGRASRNVFLPGRNQLCVVIKKFMGIERAVLDLDVMAIELLHYAVR
jgi:hypothetical protein